MSTQLLQVADEKSAWEASAKMMTSLRAAAGLKEPPGGWTVRYLTAVVQHADTKAIAVIVTDTRLLTTADAAKCVTVPPADEAKWQPKWDASSISPKP
jgi:hypothetical protein